MFFDWTRSKLDEFESAWGTEGFPGYTCEFLCADARDLLTDEAEKVTHVVSSANCFLYMDGGSDAAYLYVFGRDLEARAKAKAASYGLRTALGRSYLPIGSAITVPTDSATCPWLIAAPTMVHPSDIRGTDNVYHAMLAVTRVLPEGSVAAVTLMGMGYGKMEAAESVAGMQRALREGAAYGGPDHVVPECACPQRDDVYGNRELVECDCHGYPNVQRSQGQEEPG